MKTPETRYYKNRIVKRNVSRVEGRKVKGWQVRWPGHAKYFSDAAYGGELRSLTAANTYRDIHFPGVRCRAKEEKGVRVIEVRKENRPTPQVYAVASNPQRGKPDIRKYIGTVNTVTPEKVKAGVAAASKMRSRMIEEHKKRYELI